MTTRSPSLITISIGISSFSAPSSSDCESEVLSTQQATKNKLGAYKIIEQVLYLTPRLLPCSRQFETGLSHVIQIVCAAGDQHNEPCNPRQVADEGHNSTQTFQ